MCDSVNECALYSRIIARRRSVCALGTESFRPKAMHDGGSATQHEAGEGRGGRIGMGGEREEEERGKTRPEEAMKLHR